MKRPISFFVLGLLLFLGCGGEKIAHRDSIDFPVAPAPVSTEAGAPKVVEGATPAYRAPDLSFKVAALSGDIQWDAPITADQPAAFEVRFWPKADATRTAVAPHAPPQAFVVMKCCKTVTNLDLREIGGAYRAEDIRLAPGEYILYIQLGKGPAADRSSIDLVVQ